MPRSGSTLLCDLLTQTGVAGHPNSFFCPQSIADFAAEWDVPAPTLESFDQSYIETAIAHGSARTGCFGMRIMWQNNIPGLLQRLVTLFPRCDSDLDRLHAAFGPLAFIHLSRQDRVAEAVSYAMAEQTGLWHRHADGTEMERIAPPTEPIYHFDQIQLFYQEVNEGHAQWDTWFADQGIKPLRVIYEDLAHDPLGAMRTILRFLDLDPAAADGITPGTARMADARNADWAARFRTEAGLAPTPTAR